VKLPGSLFLGHAAQRKGAIVERGDGELSLANRLTIITDIGSPVFAIDIATPTGPQDESHWARAQTTQTGATAAASAIITRLAPGIWTLDGVFAYTFGAGTNDIVSTEELRLDYPGAISPMSLLRLHRIGGNQPVIWPFRFELDLPVVQNTSAVQMYTLRLDSSATVALDSIALFCSVLCQRKA